MKLLNGSIRPMYFKYLSAAFGSAMITSVYSIVDTAMVGQYHGPEGTAALAVVAPVWNIIYSLGLLMGIGGSVIFSTKRGSGTGGGSENQYFTASVLGAVLLSLLAWAGILGLERPILTFFGADEALLALAQRYMLPIKYVFPLFLFNQMLAAFLRNDGDPGRATAAVLAGGIFSTYYFQAIMKPRAAFVVSVARGLVISGVLILLLPVLAGAEALWLAMPITEVLVMVYAAAVMRSYTAALKG